MRSPEGVCATEFAAVKAGDTVEDLREFGNCQINRCFVTLTDLSSKISASKVMTSSDAAALQREISSPRSGLAALKATIDAKTAILALRSDIVKIAADYRVHLLITLIPTP